MPEDYDIPGWVSERQPRRGGPATSASHAQPGPAAYPVAAHAGSRPQSRRELRPRAEPPRAGRHRLTAARHRGPSRRVRLHRTIAAVAVVVMLASGGLWLHERGATAVAASSPVAAISPAPASGTATEVSSTPTPSPTATPSPTTSPTPSVVVRGSGTFTTVAFPSLADTSAPSGARVVRVAFQIEGGLGIDPAPVADKIARTLLDKRGWEPKDRLRFRFVTAAQAARGEVDITVRLASPDTTDQLCRPLDTNGVTSCFNNHRAVLNARRWLLGVSFYGSKLDAYRTYMVNHEVGHGLGHGHVGCPGAGAAAPTMMQQTLRLDGCVANPYPMVA